MVYKVSFMVAALAAMCSGQYLNPYLARRPYAIAAPAVAHAPIAVAHAPIDEYDPHPQYSFQYQVNDPLTGDSHGQHESRDGDVVQGSYSLAESDGSIRTVEYTADSLNGFNAVVHKDAAGHPAPVAVAAPAPYAYSRPLTYLH